MTFFESLPLRYSPIIFIMISFEASLQIFGVFVENSTFLLISDTNTKDCDDAFAVIVTGIHTLQMCLRD